MQDTEPVELEEPVNPLETTTASPSSSNVDFQYEAFIRVVFQTDSKQERALREHMPHLIACRDRTRDPSLLPNLEPSYPAES